MLSLEDCRRLLGRPDLSDAEVTEIRDTLYAFARTLVDGFLADHSLKCDAKPKKPSS